MRVQSLVWEDPLKEGMPTHSNILAWRIPMDRGAWWAMVHTVCTVADWAVEHVHNWAIEPVCFLWAHPHPGHKEGKNFQIHSFNSLLTRDIINLFCSINVIDWRSSNIHLQNKSPAIGISFCKNHQSIMCLAWIPLLIYCQKCNN